MLKNYVNILSIIATFLPLVSCRYFRCWRLGFGASSSKSQSSASRHCPFFVVVGSGVLSCGCVRRILHLLVRGVLSLLSAAASQSSMKSLVYIRLTMHATTMDPQHQAQNGPSALQCVWLLYFFLPSPQSKLTYHFVPKFQQVIGTNREVFKRVLVLIFATDFWIKQPVYICIGQRFGWVIYLLLPSQS